MKNLTKHLVIPVLTFLAALTILSCEDSFDNDTYADDLAIPITVADTSIKAPGRGQYKMRLLSGDVVNAKLDLSSVQPVSSLLIRKTRNGAADVSFGTNGSVTVTSGLTDAYEFNYETQVEDIDQLVGFTFEATGSNGAVVASDLTLIVTLSPRDNIPQKRWAWTSKIWVDAGNVEDLKECEKDNYWLFNADGTMGVGYGTDTGAGDCLFDGFNIYLSWELSEDGQTFTTTRSGLFDPTIVTEVYRVKSLTTEKMLLEIDLDLTVFGLTAEETFIYEYTALPK